MKHKREKAILNIQKQKPSAFLGKYFIFVSTDEIRNFVFW